jgi:hypothetical protein
MVTAWPTLTLLAADAVALALVALDTATAERPVTLVPLICTATVNDPAALPTS